MWLQSSDGTKCVNGGIDKAIAVIIWCMIVYEGNKGHKRGRGEGRGKEKDEERDRQSDKLINEETETSRRM